MIIKLIVEGKECITEKINTDTDDFLKRIEALYASVLNNKENFPEECGCAEISLSIVDPERIRELNLSYRDIDSSTDILSFPLWEESMPVTFSSTTKLGLRP